MLFYHSIYGFFAKKKVLVICNFFTPVNEIEATCDLDKQTFKYKAASSYK